MTELINPHFRGTTHRWRQLLEYKDRGTHRQSGYGREDFG